MRKPNSRGFWRCDTTGRTYAEKAEGRSYWASLLEFRVWNAMIASGLDGVVRQWNLDLLPGCYGLPNATWDCDFILPARKLIIEAKGQWINNKSASAEKAKFLLQVRLAHSLGWEVLVVGEKPFSVGGLQVQDYKSINWREYA